MLPSKTELETIKTALYKALKKPDNSFHANQIHTDIGFICGLYTGLHSQNDIEAEIETLKKSYEEYFINNQNLEEKQNG